MLKFSIAGYYSQHKVNIPFLFIYNNHPTWFYDDRIIDSVYGSLPGLPWNGGRLLGIVDGYYPMREEIYDLRDAYYNLNVSLRHTFTNTQLPEEALNDYRTLTWVKACEKEGNSVILVDPKLKEYIENRFPLYSFIWSTCLCCHDIDQINKLSKNDLLVLDYNFNTNDKALS